MTGKIIDFLARRKSRNALPPAKVAQGLDRPRFLYVGSKVPRGGRDSVELCIVSNEAGKKRRILSRVTVYIDELHHQVRAVEAEPPFTPQTWIHDAEVV
ncbi:hypothetical protein H9L13_01155 [Sphingomonas lutea]|uniref:Uncharacterized protein n=1 Tax=Sphingomonas lutea TaxID=1045317 RepID=A0A7G9SIC3_9SPHN|nr:hypothetical protein [Sphingomonas lutea]QNN67598.1 hypothetical protein H9L13_01155 [Sphingomonas lutea]